jgi:FtsH-binding integral membrane protein
MKEHHVSIWFLIGLQLSIFGVLIAGAGIYGFYFPPPPDQQTVLGNLHAGIWWGAIMLVLGVFYTVKFRPGKNPTE